MSPKCLRQNRLTSCLADGLLISQACDSGVLNVPLSASHGCNKTAPLLASHHFGLLKSLCYRPRHNVCRALIQAKKWPPRRKAHSALPINSHHSGHTFRKLIMWQSSHLVSRLCCGATRPNNRHTLSKARTMRVTTGCRLRSTKSNGNSKIFVNRQRLGPYAQCIGIEVATCKAHSSCSL